MNYFTWGTTGGTLTIYGIITRETLEHCGVSEQAADL